LIPSRRLLLEDVVENFDRIRRAGIANVGELLHLTKTKPMLQSLADELGLDEHYLTLLVREIRSLRPLPIKLKDFPQTAGLLVQRLASLGIRNTTQLFDRIVSPESRLELALRTRATIEEIDRLARLTDLSRIRWVNHIFAFVLLEAGYRSAMKVAEADYHALYRHIKALNDEREIYKGQIGENDMKRIVDAAQLLTHEVRWP
ncbi:MAG: DUF4332 domain-containing protein, partial [Bacteroidota bacterium]